MPYHGRSSAIFGRFRAQDFGKRGKVVLTVATHDPAVYDYATAVYELEDGKLERAAECGSVSLYLNRCARARAGGGRPSWAFGLG
jgi:ABC-type lipoprotein export system ATPase subunit